MQFQVKTEITDSSFSITSSLILDTQRKKRERIYRVKLSKSSQELRQR
jgi:hypothetical protein